MACQVKVGGTWHSALPWVRVGGVWKRVPYSNPKVGGSWKTCQNVSTASFAGNWTGGGASPGPGLSASRPVTLPTFNPGNFTLRNVTFVTTTFKVSVNGAAMVNCTEGYAFSLSAGQTLQFQIQGGAMFDGASCSVRDETTGVDVAQTCLMSFTS